MKMFSQNAWLVDEEFSVLALTIHKIRRFTKILYENLLSRQNSIDIGVIRHYENETLGVLIPLFASIL